MSAFEQLHPALQHHVVNALGWRSLRPLQEAAIEPVMAGSHCLLLAPTAGGKTEAAVFPLLSRMLREDWQGVSLLYVCPLRALLNDLHQRLEFLAGLVGRQCAVWHGDVTTGTRNRIRRDRPDILLTTPESLEGMLVSCRTDHAWLFADLRAVVVDEIHAFAGDDRGWHLACVLERLGRVAGRELQRIGLSATVGNPDALLEWYAGHCEGARQVIAIRADAAAAGIDVQVDYVASLENAVTVVSRLHRGEKRLIFCDSRARVEQLGALLRDAGVTTFVTHSSLSGPERRRAEQGFVATTDCVMVATSALELGIDIGDLDRVIQIDAPSTVASFLQRVGRTGRRPGTRRNCLFLALSAPTLVQTAALVDLWTEGFVEPITPPAVPYHVFVQQLLAIILQEHGLPNGEWSEWIGRVQGVSGLPHLRALVAHMLETHVLAEDQGVLGLGEQGERSYGFRNFMDLLSVFTSPPLFLVRHGRREIGFVGSTAFNRGDEPTVLLLAGRAWRVTRIDWMRLVADAEPCDQPGRSSWSGLPAALSPTLCRAIRRVLCGDGVHPSWSRRAREGIQEARTEHAFLAQEGVVLQKREDATRVWTFAGRRANTTIALAMERLSGRHCRAENLFLDADTTVTADVLKQAADLLGADGSYPEALRAVCPASLDDLKFSEALPPDLVFELYCARTLDLYTAKNILGAESHLDERATSCV